MSVTDTPIIAVCPHCASHFRVSTEVMQQAHGAVRCGDCKKIFNARFHQWQAQVPPPQVKSADEHPLPPSTQRFDAEEDLDAFEATLRNALTDPDDTDESWMDQADPFAIQDEEESLTLRPDSDPLPSPTHNSPTPAWKTKGKAWLQTLTAQGQPWVEKLPAGLRKRPLWLLAIPVVVLALILILAAASPSSEAQINHHWGIQDLSIRPGSERDLIGLQFVLVQQNSQPTEWPRLRIELLNASRQVTFTQDIAASELVSPQAEASPGNQHSLMLEVPRPAIFVQSARVTPLVP